MTEQLSFLPEQVSSEDWKNTPTNVKHLVNSLLSKVALSESESYLVQFLDATPIGIAVHDVMGKLIYINSDLAPFLISLSRNGFENNFKSMFSSNISMNSNLSE